MTLKVRDKIEVRVNAVWKPAVIKELFIDKDTEYLLAEFPEDQLMHFQKVMLINEFSVWRYPENAPLPY